MIRAIDFWCAKTTALNNPIKLNGFIDAFGRVRIYSRTVSGNIRIDPERASLGLSASVKTVLERVIATGGS